MANDLSEPSHEAEAPAAEMVETIVAAVEAEAAAAVEAAEAKVEVAQDIIEAQNDAALQRLENEADEERDERIDQCLYRLSAVDESLSQQSSILTDLQLKMGEIFGMVTGLLATTQPTQLPSPEPPSTEPAPSETTSPETVTQEPDPASVAPTKPAPPKRRWI